MADLTGTIFDIKKYSINDGPGIRTTVFFSGCPLACTWCHNPEGLSFTPELLYREARCSCCGACVERCPAGAISLSAPRGPDGGAAVQTDRALCIRCGACIAECYGGARQLTGRDVTVGDVMAQVEREVPFYDESDGGATFSGGEPLMQPQFLAALLRACREQEIHTVLDTSGLAPWEVLDAVRRDVDLFLYDLKHMDSESHRAATGAPNEAILSNLRRLSELGHRLLVRIPVVPGLNDDEANLRKSGEFLASLPALEGVELVGYHELARGKREALGRGVGLSGTRPPTAPEMARAAGLVGGFGLSVSVR